MTVLDRRMFIRFLGFTLAGFGCMASAPGWTTDATDDLTRALVNDSTVTAHFRSYYLDRNNPDKSVNAAWATGGWLGYESGWLADILRIGLVGYTSQPLWAPAGDDGTLLLKPQQQGYTVLGQAYVSLKFGDAVFTGYRQAIDQPEVNPQDNRMTPNLVEGATVSGRFDSFNYFFAYLDGFKSRNSDTFVNFAAAARAPSGVNEGMWLGSLSYTPMRDLVFRVSSYTVPDVLTSTYTDVAWLTPINDQVKLRLGAQYMYQGSNGDNLLTGSAFHTWAGGLKTEVIWGPVTLTGIYTETGQSAAYRSPYGTWAGYTTMIVRDFDRAGERAWLVGGTLDFSFLNLQGLSFNANAVFGSNAIDPLSHAALSDATEYNYTLDYRFTDSIWPDSLKPLWLRARAARVEERLAGVTTVLTDYRIIANYEWKFGNTK